MPKLLNVPMLIERYTGKRFGSWIVGTGFHKQNKNWCVDVQCDCGKTQIVTISALALHRGCSCEYLAKVQNYRNKGYAPTDLEKIWPSVIKAGRDVIEKYKNASSGLRSFPN